MNTTDPITEASKVARLAEQIGSDDYSKDTMTARLLDAIRVKPTAQNHVLHCWTPWGRVPEGRRG